MKAKLKMRLCNKYECSWRRQTGRGRKRRSQMTVQPTVTLVPNEKWEDGNMRKRGSSLSHKHQKAFWKGACFTNMRVWLFISIFCLLWDVFSESPVTSCFLKSSNSDRLGAQVTLSSVAWPCSALGFTACLYPIVFRLAPNTYLVLIIEGDSV